MPEIRDLLDNAAAVRPPPLDDLRAIAGRRRRRLAVVTMSAVVMVVLTGLLLVAPGGERDTAPAPVAPPPTSASRFGLPPPTTVTPPPRDRTRGPFPVLSAEEIRNHPDAEALQGDSPVTGARGVTARIWSVCLADCSRDTRYQEGELQEAVEVSRDNFTSGALYRLESGSQGISHVVDDWFVLDSLESSSMVSSRGETRILTRGEPVDVTQIAGPLVYANGVAFVDLEALELHAITSPPGTLWDWWGAADSWYWGGVYLVADSGEVIRHAAVWRNPDGTFGVEVLPIGKSRGSTGMLKSGQPGTMAVVEHFADPRLAHISTDYGATWEIRLIPHDVASGGRLPGNWTTWPAP